MGVYNGKHGSYYTFIIEGHKYELHTGKGVEELSNDFNLPWCQIKGQITLASIESQLREYIHANFQRLYHINGKFQTKEDKFLWRKLSKYVGKWEKI